MCFRELVTSLLLVLQISREPKYPRATQTDLISTPPPTPVFVISNPPLRHLLNHVLLHTFKTVSLQPSETLNYIRSLDLADLVGDHFELSPSRTSLSHPGTTIPSIVGDLKRRSVGEGKCERVRFPPLPSEMGPQCYLRRRLSMDEMSVQLILGERPL